MPSEDTRSKLKPFLDGLERGVVDWPMYKNLGGDYQGEAMSSMMGEGYLSPNKDGNYEVWSKESVLGSPSGDLRYGPEGYKVFVTNEQIAEQIATSYKARYPKVKVIKHKNKRSKVTARIEHR